MKITCPRCKRRIKLRRGEKHNCICGKYLDYRTFFNKKIPYDVYLIDANIFIYAFKYYNKKSKACRKIIFTNADNIKIGTTYNILNELGIKIQSQLPTNIIKYSIGNLQDELLDIKTNFLKQPSEADKSLLKASIDHPEIHGLITYDADFRNIGAAGIVNKKSSRQFWLGNAENFVLKKLRFNT